MYIHVFRWAHSVRGLMMYGTYPVVMQTSTKPCHTVFYYFVRPLTTSTRPKLHMVRPIYSGCSTISMHHWTNSTTHPKTLL